MRRPLLSDFGAQVLEEVDTDTLIGPVNFTIADPETTPASLTVTAASDNQLLIRDATIVLGGAGAERTLTWTLPARASGAAIITVTVSDGHLTTAKSLPVTVGGSQRRWQTPARISSLIQGPFGSTAGRPFPRALRLSYEWPQTSGAPVELSDSATAQPTIVARKAGDYVFLSSFLPPRSSPADTVTVTVNNVAPSAEAGYEQEVSPA